MYFAFQFNFSKYKGQHESTVQYIFYTLMLLIILLSTDYDLAHAFEKNILTLKHGLSFAERIFAVSEHILK